MKTALCSLFLMFFGLSLLLIQPNSVIAQNETPAPNPIEHATILETDSEGIWRFDPATGARSLYYRYPAGIRYQGYFIDYENQELYAVEVPDSINWFQWQFGRFDLVKIDLLTGEKSVLYTGDDIGIDGHYMNSKDYILLAAYPHNYIRDRLPPKDCLLNLKSLSCTPIADIAISYLYSPQPEIWLNYSTFTTGTRTVNIFTSDIQQILDGWTVYQLAPVQGTNKSLVIALQNSTDSTNKLEAGFYILHTSPFRLSSKICDIPAFTAVFTPRVSFDGRKVVYLRQDHSTYVNSILDLQTCQALNISPQIDLTWLPDNINLIGTLRDDPNSEHRVIVRVNANTGDVTNLSDTNEYVSFVTIP